MSLAKKAWPLLWSFLQIVVFFAPLVGLAILLDNTTPRHWFPFPVPLLILLWLIMLFVFSRSLWRTWHMRRKRAIQNQPKPPMTKRTRVLYIVLIFVIIGTTFLANYLISQRNSAVNQDLLMDSRQHFTIHLYGNIPKAYSDQTQVELERAFRSLSTRLEPSALRLMIEVYIFPNLEEFRQQTGEYDFNGLSYCTERGPVIVLPVVRSESDPSTSTPLHEMVHAIVFMNVGCEKSTTIPRWFNEGLADFECRKGFWDIFDRIALRGWLWWNRGKIMAQDSLGKYNANNSTSDEDRVLYSCSFEFMRYVVSVSTADAPWTIVSKVGGGESFEKAFEDTVGTQWEDLNAKWLISF